MIKLALMENTDKCSLHWIKYFYLDILYKKLSFEKLPYLVNPVLFSQQLNIAQRDSIAEMMIS